VVALGTSKKGAKNSMKNSRSTENAINRGEWCCGALHWSMPDPSKTLHLIRCDVLRCRSEDPGEIIHKEKNLAS
jgi:hypothetical protein